MMKGSGQVDTDWLVEQARCGSTEARTGLMERHRARLRQMVNDLLDLSKMEAGMMRLRREMLDPRAMAEAAHGVRPEPAIAAQLLR